MSQIVANAVISTFQNKVAHIISKKLPEALLYSVFRRQ